jgi:hypothetical protein
MWLCYSLNYTNKRDCKISFFRIGTNNMMRLKITVGFAALALATAFTSAPAFAAKHHHRHQTSARPVYNYSSGYGGPSNYSGYVSGQPGPSSSIEAIH